MAGSKPMRRRRMPVIGAFATRPRLAGSLAVGLAVGVVLTAWGRIEPVANVVLGWDVACLCFAALILQYMAKRTPKDMRAHAAEEDEGRAVILIVVMTAGIMAMLGAAGELSAAKHSDGRDPWLHAGLAFATVALSWVFVQLNLALHYAHEFYDRDAQHGRGDRGGLHFPGREAPDYWDFLHFSVIIGVASQTADIAITSKALRRLNTAHAMYAFTFNTIVVALTITLLASLFD
jgi:uncharacterized membrane protein